MTRRPILEARMGGINGFQIVRGGVWMCHSTSRLILFYQNKIFQRNGVGNWYVSTGGIATGPRACHPRAVAQNPHLQMLFMRTRSDYL